MSFAYWMVFVAALLPYATVGLVKSRGLDNQAPREAMEKLTGWRKRADWAHRNHFEAFPAFAAAVVIAYLANVSISTIDLLAGAFILARIAYTVEYLADRATLRTLIWVAGFACVAALLISAAIA